MFHCNKYGKTKTHSTGQRLHNNCFKCNCPWAIRYKYLSVKNKDDIVVTKICPKHELPCQPCADQLIVARKCSGDYQPTADLALQHLVNILSTDHFVSCNTIRNSLKNKDST